MEKALHFSLFLSFERGHGPQTTHEIINAVLRCGESMYSPLPCPPHHPQSARIEAICPEELVQEKSAKGAGEKGRRGGAHDRSCSLKLGMLFWGDLCQNPEYHWCVLHFDLCMFPKSFGCHPPWHAGNYCLNQVGKRDTFPDFHSLLSYQEAPFPHHCLQDSIPLPPNPHRPGFSFTYLFQSCLRVI